MYVITGGYGKMSTEFITENYNPDVLSCIANLSSDEVFTSPEIANRMIDLLPDELFSNPNSTFLDPACKSGIFLREIVKRLIKGLEKQIPDINERLEHIFHNQVFGIATTELTGLLSRRSVYCSKDAESEYALVQFDRREGNIRYERLHHYWNGSRCIFCGANKSQYDREDGLEEYAYEFIHTEKPERILNMKFDVIISNPPYMLSDGGGGSGKSSTSIYQLFVEQAIKMNPRYVVMIIPSRWYSGGKGLNQFRSEMLNDKRLKKLVDYVDSKECFANGVDIPGGICYFMWQADYDGDCEVVNVQKNGTRDIDIRSLNEYQTFVRQNKALSIIKKVKSKKEKIMSDQVQSRRSFGIDSNVKFDKDGDYLMRSSSGYGPVRADKVTSGFDKIDKWKTIISKVTTEHAGVPSKDGKMKVLAVVETLKPQTVCSESYLVTGIFDTEEESNNLEIYLKTKFVRFLMTQMLASMNMSKSTFTFVPVQDFKKLWTDEDLYEKYGLDNSERELIEDAIRPMGDKNG